MCQKGSFTCFHPTSVEAKLQLTPWLHIPGLCATLLISLPVERQNDRSSHLAWVLQNPDIANTSQNENQIPGPAPKGTAGSFQHVSM